MKMELSNGELRVMEILWSGEYLDKKILNVKRFRRLVWIYCL